ncbi:hypothetical protein TRVL_06088 [Trypanosoma vivax]|nr:hypothetical protein TRVL_06088 [Trypanosoma vivax]
MRGLDTCGVAGWVNKSWVVGINEEAHQWIGTRPYARGRDNCVFCRAVSWRSDAHGHRRNASMDRHCYACLLGLGVHRPARHVAGLTQPLRVIAQSRHFSSCQDCLRNYRSQTAALHKRRRTHQFV